MEKKRKLITGRNTAKVAGELGLIIGTIAAFDRKCAAAEYTDTGKVWDIFHAIKNAARRALRAVQRR